MQITKWDGKPITKPGLYDVPASAYFGGAIPGAVSQSSLKTILDGEAGPARFRYLADNPPAPKDAWDLGTTVHALRLGKGREQIRILDYDSYRTNAAKAERDQARAQGFTPMLQAEFDKAQALADGVPGWVGELLTGGHPEVAAVDVVDGLTVKGQLDYLLPDRIIDLKTAADIRCRAFGRSVWNFGYFFQAALYRLLVERLTGKLLPYFVLAIETSGPPLARIFEIDNDYLAVGEQQVLKALDLYKQCVETGEWPGYSPEPATLDAPPWAADEVAEMTITELENLIGENNE